MTDAIVPLYPILPKFYVGIVFHELDGSSFFIGGKPVDRFVRISVDHIARQFPNDESRARWLTKANATLEPFTTGRGYDWEIHIDETPPSLWLIQGMRPPPPNSDLEKRWIAENRPVAP